jgi:hypothetical protein
MGIKIGVVGFSRNQFNKKEAHLKLKDLLCLEKSYLKKKLNGMGSKGLKRHSADNPLKNLAMESTIWMIMCIFIAYGLSMQNVEWFFYAMLLIIGGRYLTFATLFGKKLYWVLGASLGMSAFVLFRLQIQSFGSLLTGAIIEIVFGFLMYSIYRKSI